MGEASEPETKKVKRGWLKLVIAIMLLGFFFMAQIIITLVVGAKVKADPFVQTGIAEVCVAALSVLAVVALGGRKWLKVDARGIRYAFRVAWPILIVGFVASAYSVYSAVTGAEPIPEGVPARLVGILLLCLGIGVFEECLYRGILFGGLLGVTGSTRKGVMFAVVASSIWFGYAHVGIADFSTLGTAAQAILKIVETGMFGIVMCDIVLHTRSLGAAALFHGFNDMLFMGASAVLAGSEASSSYTTNESPEAVTYALIAYGVIVAVYLVPTIRSLMRIWKERQYCQGPFMKQNAQE